MNAPSIQIKISTYQNKKIPSEVEFLWRSRENSNEHRTSFDNKKEDSAQEKWRQSKNGLGAKEKEFKMTQSGKSDQWNE